MNYWHTLNQMTLKHRKKKMKKYTGRKLSTDVLYVMAPTHIECLRIKDIRCVADANEIKNSIHSHKRCLVCDQSSVKYRTRGKEEENNIHKRRLWGRILQSFVESTSLSFGPDPRWGLLGLPSFFSNSCLCVSEGREGPNVRTRAPTVRKPCQDLHNEHEGSTRGTLVLINNIKVNVPRTASGLLQHSLMGHSFPEL